MPLLQNVVLAVIRKAPEIAAGSLELFTQF